MRARALTRVATEVWTFTRPPSRVSALGGSDLSSGGFEGYVWPEVVVSEGRLPATAVERRL